MSSFSHNLEIIKDKEQQSRTKIDNAINECKQRQLERKEKNKKELEDYKKSLEEELKKRKIQLESSKVELENEERSAKEEMDEVKKIAETKKSNMINFITQNILDVDLTLPAVLKPRAAKK